MTKESTGGFLLSLNLL